MSDIYIRCFQIINEMYTCTLVQIQFLLFQSYFLAELADNESPLDQVMAWHRTGDNPVPDPVMTQFSAERHLS